MFVLEIISQSLFQNVLKLVIVYTLNLVQCGKYKCNFIKCNFIKWNVNYPRLDLILLGKIAASKS